MQMGFVNVQDIWDFGFMWDTFAFLLKLASPFTMIAVAILAVGALLIYIVVAVRRGVDK